MAAVTGLSQTSGPTAGGYSVTITGVSFTGASAVYFGAVAATSFTLNSDTSITATVPSQASGTVDITVITAGNVSPTSSADQFTYVAPPVNTVPGPQFAFENTNLVFSAANSNLISIADPDADGNIVQVTLTATNGTLTLNGTTALSFSFADANGTGTGTGSGDTTMTFRGTVSDIDAALAGLTFTAAFGYSGSASLEIITNDLGNTAYGIAQTADNTAPITIVGSGFA